MSKILFHPDIPMIEAARIAHSQGGRLVWREERMRHLGRAMQHNKRALAEIWSDNYEGALVEIRAARAEIEKVKPCAA